MKCPYCGFPDDKVVDSRPTEDGTGIRRRRECLKCKERFNTFERIETIKTIVVKKDGTRQAFDREKVLRGVVKACEKRPVSLDDAENLVNEIEQYLSNSMKREVASDEIGELVMNKLKALDEVSYVRFASVYKQFKDVDTFMNELKKIIKEK